MTSAEEIAPGEDKMTVRNEPAQTDPAQMRRAIDCITIPSCVMGGGNGAKKDLEDAARNRSLTARQRAVLELLSRGDTNKAIAPRLG